MPPSVALNGQVTMIQVIKCLKCQQVQKPCHAFLMALYVYLCLCFRCFNFLLVGLVMSHPVEKRAAPPRTSLDPMLENFEIVLCCLFCSRFCPLLLIQLCGTAPARTCQCCQLGGGRWGGQPKTKPFHKQAMDCSLPSVWPKDWHRGAGLGIDNTWVGEQ